MSEHQTFTPEKPNDWTIIPSDHRIPYLRAENPDVAEHYDKKYGDGEWELMPTNKLGHGVLAVRTPTLERLENTSKQEKTHA